MDSEGKEAVFCQLSLKYNWLETKKEKMDFLIEVEQVIFPRLSIEAIHIKSLIRKLNILELSVDAYSNFGPRNQFH